MELKEKLELGALKNRKEFCRQAISDYNKKLPKKMLIAFCICLVYAFIRMNINPEEKISFYTTLGLMGSFLFVYIVIDHLRLLNQIKKDIREVDARITALTST